MIYAPSLRRWKGLVLAAWVFTVPPGWPQPPAGWVPPAGWGPDPSWPPAPEGWQFWTAVDEVASDVPPAAVRESWSTRRAAKHAERDHEQAVAAWQAEQDLADELSRTATAVAAGTTSVPGFVLHAGERAVWTAEASLIEPRIQPGHYVGASSGVSLHIAKGVNYRVGGSRGHYVPGPEVQTPVDHGRVGLTTARVIFAGSRVTREWAFTKLISVDTSADDHVSLIHVSNRQKVSGLALGSLGRRFQAYLALALAISETGPADAAQSWAAAADEHRVTKP